MGASTYTVTVTVLTVFGNKRIHELRYSCTSYGTDGLPLTPAIAGMSIIDCILGVPYLDGGGQVTNGPVIISYNSSTGYILLSKTATAGTDATTNITTAGTLVVVVMGS